MLLKLNKDFLVDVSEEQIIEDYFEEFKKIFESVQNKTAEGSEMTGWISWINKDHTDLVNRVTAIRERWLKHGVDTVVIIGTGGSYIGCRAGLEFVNGFKKTNFNFLFVPSFSERFLGEAMENLSGKKFAIVVISKSGTTLESSVAFRVLRHLLYKKESEEYSKLIIAVTDKSKGVLRELATKRNIESFVIEDDIGGRYSTLTAVGLVPMILGGIDANSIFAGARKAFSENFHGDLRNSSAGLYAAMRHYFFTSKKLVVECIASYDPHVHFCLEKMKQLFAESEGKNEKGLMPVLLNFTPDLHSVGQLLQDGLKTFFETIVLVNKPKFNLSIEKSLFEDDDKLDWLCGKTVKEINNCACNGTLDAHCSNGKINNIVIELDSWQPEVFGYFYFWLSLVAMFSSYFFKVNPFNQPGVETYKKRMFSLLGKD